MKARFQQPIAAVRGPVAPGHCLVAMARRATCTDDLIALVEELDRYSDAACRRLLLAALMTLAPITSQGDGT